MNQKYYELIERKTPPPNSGMILTAAVLSCSLCGDTIDGMGGPGNGAVCERCGDLMIHGQCRGAVKWDEK